jgi:urea carboxylase
VQVWNSWHHGENPWLLQFFDRISWYPVSAEELLDLRADAAAGRLSLDIEPGEFALSKHQSFLADNATSIASFRDRQAAAFAAERSAWAAAGEFDPKPEIELGPTEAVQYTAPPGATVIEAPFVATIWRVDVHPGQSVAKDTPLLALEAMKTETILRAPATGSVLEVLVKPGEQVAPGTALVVLK